MTLTVNGNKTCQLMGRKTVVSTLVGQLCPLSQPPSESYVNLTAHYLSTLF